MTKIPDAMALVDAGVPDMCYELNALRLELAQAKRREVEKQMEHLSCDQEISRQRALVARLAESTSALLARAEKAEESKRQLEEREAELQAELLSSKQSSVAFAESSRTHASAERQLTARVKTLEDVLKLTVKELSRLRYLHLPMFEGKIGEPDKLVIKSAKQALDAKEPKS